MDPTDAMECLYSQERLFFYNPLGGVGAKEDKIIHIMHHFITLEVCEHG